MRLDLVRGRVGSGHKTAPSVGVNEMTTSVNTLKTIISITAIQIQVQRRIMHVYHLLIKRLQVPKEQIIKISITL